MAKARRKIEEEEVEVEEIETEEEEETEDEVDSEETEDEEIEDEEVEEIEDEDDGLLPEGTDLMEHALEVLEEMGVEILNHRFEDEDTLIVAHDGGHKLTFSRRSG